MSDNDIFLSIQRLKAIFQAVEEAPDQSVLESLHPEVRIQAILRGYLDDSPETIKRFIEAYAKLKREEMPDLKDIETRHELEQALLAGMSERYGSRYHLHRPSLQLRPRGRRFPSYTRKK